MKLSRWNILQAMQLLCVAWKNVTPLTIANCFARARFLPENMSHEITDSIDCNFWEGLVENVGVDSSFVEYTMVGDNLVTCADEDDREMECPSSDIVARVLDMLEKFIYFIECGENLIDSFRKVESGIIKEIRGRRKQISLLSYFKGK
jgi:hypothetical protein